MNSNLRAPACHRGFTLIELMVVVAIIGILSSIAYPNYQDYVVRSRIPAATGELASRRNLMEQFFQDNHFYSKTTPASGGTPASTSTAPVCSTDSASSPYFTFTCTANDSTYTLTATGKSGSTMEGFTYTLNQANQRASTVSGSTLTGRGWTSNGNCWVTDKAGKC